MPRAKGYLLAHTPELVEAILTDWRAGHTYKRMSKEHDLTPNTVAGIVGRNKKPGEVSERTFFHPRPSEARERPTVPSVRRPPLSGGKMPTGRSVVHQPKMVAVAGARFRECQYIAGVPSADDTCKCRAATGVSRVYCPEHEARVWRPVRSEEAA